MSLRTFHASRLAFVAFVVALLATAPVRADWLVTRDGARIETKGAWTVEGNRVVFTLPNGTLSVMRKSEVDLEASQRASAAAKAPRPAPAPPSTAEAKKPILVLTNKNVGAAAEVPEPISEETPSATEPRRPPGSARVDVVSWESRDSREVDGLEVVGSLRNTGVEIATNINVGVTVVDQDGQPLYETTAFLRSSGLAPGRSTTFRALLPGIYTLFEDPIFDVRAGAITVQGAPDPGERGDTPGDGEGFGNEEDTGELTSGEAFEDETSGGIEGVDPGEVYEENAPQPPQGDEGGSGSKR